MYLTRLVIGMHRAARASLNGNLYGLYSAEQLRRVMERERARAERCGDRFSLVEISASPDAGDDGAWRKRAARAVQRRLRITDDAGWLDRNRLGIVLPATGAAGAWKVAEDLLPLLREHSPPLACRVYCYPSDDWLRPEELKEAARPRPQEPGPVHAMESLFARRLPRWKRWLDVVTAAVALAVLAPLMALVALAVKFTSPGPVLFRQSRLGLGGRPFLLYKFRSMVADADRQKARLMAQNEQDGPAFKIRNDPRVTPIGRLLRSTSVDELPQLWNVLRGDMSLVGPRPPLHSEVVQYQTWQRRRLDVTPGLTCIWQVKGRSRVSFAEWIRMDLQYIRARSPAQDLKLLLQTLPALVLRRGM